MKELKNLTKNIFLFSIFFVVIALALSSSVSADLYLNSQTGSVYFNTSNTARMQITSGGNLILLGLANVSIPGNLSVAGNTLFVDNTTGRVGIGTSSPTYKLTVAGNAQIRGTLDMYNNYLDSVFQLSNGGGNALIITQTGSADVKVLLDSDTNLNVSNMLFVSGSSGNIGIGTTTPDNLLTVLGNELTTNAILHLNASDNFNKSVINLITLDHVLKSPVNSTGGIGVSILFRATDNASQLENIGNISAILYNSTNGSELSAITFSTRGPDTGDNSGGHLAERLRIDGTGRVGINTSSPTKTLHVVGDANISGRLDVGKLNITGVTFSQGDIDAAGSLRVAGGANISGDLGVSGKVGIGTTTPQDNLEVVGNVRVSGSLNATSINATRLNVNNTLFVNGSMVGIGTTGPRAALEVAAGSDVTSNGILIAGSRSLILRDTTKIYESGGLRIDSGDSARPINFDINGAEKVRIDTAGKVGIGTTAPATILDVKGKANFTGNFSIGETSNIFFVDNTSARVGIGTTTPGEKLHVVGNANVSQTLFAPVINITTANLTISSASGSVIIRLG